MHRYLWITHIISMFVTIPMGLTRDSLPDEDRMGSLGQYAFMQLFDSLHSLYIFLPFSFGTSSIWIFKLWNFILSKIKYCLFFAIFTWWHQRLGLKSLTWDYFLNILPNVLNSLVGSAVFESFLSFCHFTLCQLSFEVFQKITRIGDIMIPVRHKTVCTVS
jgi:hypothetical protein